MTALCINMTSETRGHCDNIKVFNQGKSNHIREKIREFDCYKCVATLVYSRGHSFYPFCMKLCQNVHLQKISMPEFKIGHVRSKTRSLGQFIEKLCVHSRGLSFDPVFMKLCQNLYLNEFWNRFKNRLCQVKNKVIR